MFRFSKKQSTVIDERYFKLIKPTYIFIKITPHKSIRNYNSTNIAKSIAHTYKTLDKRIRFEQRKLTFETNFKISYMIDIESNNVSFYFIVPEIFENILLEKISEIWSKATVERVDNIKPLSHIASKYQLRYKKEDALSLYVDKKSNEPLNSILNVMEIMKDDDRVTIIYNFLPCNQLAWGKQYKDTIDKIDSHKPILKEKLSTSYIVKTGLSYIIDILDVIVEILNDFMGGTNKKSNDISLAQEIAIALCDNEKISTSTKSKKESMVIDTQMVIISSSDDKTRQENNALAVCQSYRTLDEDNELNYYKITSNINPVVYKFPKVDVNTVSMDECQNFIQLPGRNLLQDHNIKYINTLESSVPEQLKNGTKCIGLNTFKGNVEKAHLTTDKDYKNLAVAVIGPTRSGKTSLLGNLARDSIEADECVIVLDYIENCGLSEEIKACIPKNKILEINSHDYTNLQGLGYNEALKETSEPFLIYESAKQQASQVSTLVNSINIDSKEIPPKMQRYLHAACLMAFVNKGAIKDVLMILQDHNTRKKFTQTIPDTLKEYLEEYVEHLKELDEYSKATKDNPAEVIGTKTNNIVGILDRFNKLKENTYMEMMLKKGIEDNINLYEEMEKNQCIFIKMPESMFATQEERDVMTNYWLTKIWMAGQVRAWKIPNRYDRKTVTVIADEIAQLQHSEEFVGNKLDQTAKFGIKFILSTMYLNQLKIREKLRTANTSYIFISGSDKNNFKEMKEEFEEKGFELEDMQKLKRFHALNYLKYEDGYWAGITKLPKPIKKQK